MSGLTAVEVGSVDVYLLRQGTTGWEFLLLQRDADTRCAGAWEVVHGHIEPGEVPEQAAVREVREETGLTPVRLYNVTVQPFYLHRQATVFLAVVFAAFVGADDEVHLGREHRAHIWLPLAAAVERVAWPRSRAVMPDILALLGTGDAGAVDDVLRVR